MANSATTNSTVSLDAYKLTKGESDWHTKYNNAMDAIATEIVGASKTLIYYGTSDDPATSGWSSGSVYIQIEE